MGATTLRVGVLSSFRKQYNIMHNIPTQKELLLRIMTVGIPSNLFVVSSSK